MKYVKRIFASVCVSLLAFFLFALAIFMRSRPLLIPDKQWQAKAVTVSGGHLPVKTYRMFGRNMPVVLYIDEGVLFYPPSRCPGEGKFVGKQKWFAIFLSGEKSRVYIPTALMWLHSPPSLLRSVGDMKHGWDIDDATFGGVWHLSREGDTVVFSNAAISVTISPKQRSFENADDVGRAIVEAARSQIGKTVRYDGSYVELDYPMGDIPLEKGVCTDVVIRALRDALGMDLQQLVHEDMRAAFLLYPKPMRWGLKLLPDKNIDHRRVLNLRRYFKRKGFSLPISENPSDYLPGDLVACMVGGTLPHIMIVSDTKTEQGVPRIIHNIGNGTREEAGLFSYPITGHYRLTHKGWKSPFGNGSVLIGVAGVIGMLVWHKKWRKKRFPAKKQRRGCHETSP